MQRLIHSQVAVGGLLVNDIDDGLPNKTAKRGIAPPKKYRRDGYANTLKQKCYIPRVQPGDVVAGYIDLVETDRVLMSVNKGVAAGLQTAGQLSIVSFLPTDIVAATITQAEINNPNPGDLTITGTQFVSVLPNITSVTLTTLSAFLLVPGAANGGVLYVAVAAGSAGEAVQIHHVVAGNNTPLTVGVVGNVITVNVATSNVGAATSTATQVVAAITGSGPASALVTSSVQGSGAGVVGAIATTNLANDGSFSLTGAQIIAGSGTVSNTSLVLPAAIVPGIEWTATSVKVRANTITTGSSVIVQ
jgi:hypothetical protein